MATSSLENMFECHHELFLTWWVLASLISDFVSCLSDGMPCLLCLVGSFVWCVALFDWMFCLLGCFVVVWKFLLAWKFELKLA